MANKNMALGKKLLLLFLAVGITPFAVVAFLSLTKSNTALSTAAFNQLTMAREIKKAQIESFFGERRGDMGVLTETVATLRNEAFNKLTAVRNIKKNQIETYFNTRLTLMEDVKKNLRFTGGVVDFTKAFARGGIRTDTYDIVYNQRIEGLKMFNDIFGFYDIFLEILDLDEGDSFIRQEFGLDRVYRNKGASDRKA